MQRYLVTATHPLSKRFDLTNALVTVHETRGGFYAYQLELGCGKTRLTAEAAIRALCFDHALSITEIRATEPESR